jgi:hypothetical protein
VATDLAIEAGAEQQEVQLPEEYKEFAQLFSDEAADRVMILTGRTPDSAVMTTRAGKYH